MGLAAWRSACRSVQKIIFLEVVIKVKHDQTSIDETAATMIQKDVKEYVAKVFDDATLDDFENCKQVGLKLASVQFEICRKMVDFYDPEDAEAFSEMIRFYASIVPDSRDAANLFGISVSTFFRWRSGEVTPRKFMRKAVKDALMLFLSDYEFDKCDVQFPEFATRLHTEKRAIH
jgi:hypothetical protein